MTKGKFIVLEGGEGSGKTTLLTFAKERFPDVVFTREPGGSTYAEKIRTLILHDPDSAQADANTHFGLFWASRADHLKNTVIPALKAGKHVITDRFDSSSFAYQICGQENRQLRELFFRVRQFYLGEWMPDMYIFLDLDPREGIKRKSGSRAIMDHFDERDFDFHDRVRAGYKEFFQSVPHVIIDANRPLSDVKAEFARTLKQLMTP